MLIGGAVGPVHRVGHGVEYFACGSLGGKTFAGEAAQEDASIGRLEREKIRPAQQVGAIVVLFLKDLAVTAEETRRIIVTRQPQANHQKRLAARLALEN